MSGFYFEYRGNGFAPYAYSRKDVDKHYEDRPSVTERDSFHSCSRSGTALLSFTQACVAPGPL